MASLPATAPGFLAICMVPENRPGALMLELEIAVRDNPVPLLALAYSSQVVPSCRRILYLVTPVDGDASGVSVLKKTLLLTRGVTLLYIPVTKPMPWTMGNVMAGAAPALVSRLEFAEKAVRESIVRTVLELSSVADNMIDCTLMGLT